MGGKNLVAPSLSITDVHTNSCLAPSETLAEKHPEAIEALARGQATVWPNGQALWGETTDTYDSGYVSFGAWQEAMGPWGKQGKPSSLVG